MGEYFTLFIGAVLINNFVLTKFLGLCIFFGVSKNFERLDRHGVCRYFRYYHEYRAGMVVI